MKQQSVQIGQATEGIVLAELLKRRVGVLIPFGAHRYDLAFDIKGKIYRVQCKTGRVRNGAILFNSCSNDNVSFKRKDYRGQIEYFAVTEPESGMVFLIEPVLVGKAHGYLRLDVKKQSDKKRIVMAEDYLIDKVLARLGFGE